MKKFIRSILIVFMITAMAIPISRFGGWSALISANAVDNAALTGDVYKRQHLLRMYCETTIPKECMTIFACRKNSQKSC